MRCGAENRLIESLPALFPETSWLIRGAKFPFFFFLSNVYSDSLYILYRAVVSIYKLNWGKFDLKMLILELVQFSK